MNVLENLKERYTIKQNCESNTELQKVAIALLNKSDGIQYFFKYWLWTFDPRQAPADLPFVPWPFQETFIQSLSDDIYDGISQLTEKSRDMGVTWMVLGTFIYCWLVHDESFLLGSRKQELVDTIGDMDSLFERVRYMIDKLPTWMKDHYGYDAKNSGFMKIYKANGASIVGEAMNPDFSRGGRYKAILLDEFAFVDKSQSVWRSCGDSAPCKIVVSTPNGSNNFFAQLRKSGRIKVNTIHWKQHPFKDDKWYAKQAEDRTNKDIAQELDINYTISAGDPFYQGFSRAIHLKKMRITKERELVLSWDYGFRHPNCSIHQISVEGIWIVVDNIFGEDQTIDEFGEYVSEYLNQHYQGFQWRHRGFGDPAGRQSSDKSRKSSEQILNEMGFKVTSIPSNSAHAGYANRKAIIEKKLRTLINGIPSLIINDVPNNYIVAEGFEGGYRYPDANKYGGISEKPVEDGWYEHPMNTIEYVAVNLFKAVEQKPRPRPEANMMGKMRQEREMVNAGISY